MIIFSNPGEIDPRLITTLGVNVKQGDSPIGFFGTGLKYAIAVALRHGQAIEIWSGDKRFAFSEEKHEIRGKTFGIVHMNEQALGFTTELGKKWELWMAYRELYCNALDEGGSVCEAARTEPKAGQTLVLVSGDAFSAVHRKRDWLLQSRPLAEGATMDIHAGPTSAVFYHDIQVGTLQRQARYAYNLKSPLSLTEDRTARSVWDVNYAIVRGLMEECQDEYIIRKAICAPEATFEGALDFNWAGITPSERFIDVVADCYATKRGIVSQSALLRCKEFLKAEPPPRAALTLVELKMLAKAQAFLKTLGHEVTEQIIVVESLGNQWLMGGAEASTKTIYLPKAAFGKGTKFIASTLLEEHLHLSLDLQDCSRAMQDWLFDRVVSLGEELQGEPL